MKKVQQRVVITDTTAGGIVPLEQAHKRLCSVVNAPTTDLCFTVSDHCDFRYYVHTSPVKMHAHGIRTRAISVHHEYFHWVLATQVWDIEAQGDVPNVQWFVNNHIEWLVKLILPKDVVDNAIGAGPNIEMLYRDGPGVWLIEGEME